MKNLDIMKFMKNKDIHLNKDICHMIFKKGIQELKDNDWTITKIAKEMNVSQAYLNKIIKYMDSITEKNIKKYNDQLEIILDKYYL